MLATVYVCANLIEMWMRNLKLCHIVPNYIWIDNWGLRPLERMKVEYGIYMYDKMKTKTSLINI